MSFPDRIRVVVLFGGESAEHDVSRETAAHVLRALDPARYELEPVAVTRDGRWLRSEEALSAIGAPESGPVRALEIEGTPVDPIPALAGTSTTVALPLVHGPRGEDGTLQGLLELADVPYVGAGVLGSALAMDKAMAKQVAAQAGIPQGRHVIVHEQDVAAATTPDQLVEQLGLPLFVKPCNMGSSIGVSRVTHLDDVPAALARAFTYDEIAVVEEEIKGREIEVALLGNRDIRCSVPGEIRPGADFYDYDDKYEDGAELLIPAPLSPAETEDLYGWAVATYRALRIEGMARVDFFYEPDGRGWLLNEVNTIPGFTPISMYPKLWAASGLSYSELLDELISLAVARFERRHSKRVTTR